MLYKQRPPTSGGFAWHINGIKIDKDRKVQQDITISHYKSVNTQSNKYV